MFSSSKYPILLVSFASLILNHFILTSHVTAQEQEPTIKKSEKKTDFKIIPKKNKIILKKKPGDEVGLNPQPSPPVDKQNQNIKLQQASQKANAQNNTLQNINKQKNESAKSNLKNIKSNDSDNNSKQLKSAGMQTMYSTASVNVSMSKDSLKRYYKGIQDLCLKVRVIAKSEQGKVWNLSAKYKLTQYGVMRKASVNNQRLKDSGPYQCVTDKTAFPANQEIQIITSLIDSKYKVEPLIQKANFKANISGKDTNNVKITVVRK